MGLVKVAVTCHKFSDASRRDVLHTYPENDGYRQNNIIPPEDPHETPEEMPFPGNLERIKGLWDVGE